VLKRVAFLAALSLTVTAGAQEARGTARKPPKLIVQITVDQLRGDLPFRYLDRFSRRGFRLFLDHGVWYAAARHDHAEYETIVGHTTLATGAWPSRHGMIANSWFEVPTAGGGESRVDSLHDPAQSDVSYKGERDTTPGVSPLGISTTTFSDELAITTAGRAKIFAVSIKDRGAVPMSGHAGRAFWYSTRDGCFETSTFYYATPPQWVTDWCGRQPAHDYANTSWTLREDRARYLFRDVTNVYPAGSVAETNMVTMEQYRFERTFPHPLGAAPALYQNLTITPMGDELTARFAKELIRQEGLGADDITDYLAISFSVTDLISHWFSPSSLESEENLLRLDLTLQSLFAYLDDVVGLGNTLIVLSADHGGTEYPEYLATINVPTGRLTEKTVRDAATKAVAARFKTDDPLIQSFSPPYFYLDEALLEKHSLTSAEVEIVIARAVMKVPGIATAVPASQLLNGGGAADDEFLTHLRRNYFPGRSGDVHVVPKAQWQLDPDKGNALLAHSIPWSYNGYVPVAFAGAGVPTKTVYRAISTTDVAATLAAYMKTKFPSGNVGVPLVEVVGGR
jgi:Type I phosphodiesterase / nucleotide pyrophosphatase